MVSAVFPLLLVLLFLEGLFRGQPRSDYLLVDVESQGYLLDGGLAALDLVDVVQLLSVLYVSALALGSRWWLLGTG